MQLAIKHAYKNIENITELIISFDDGHKFFSDNIVDDAAKYEVMFDLVPRIKRIYPEAKVISTSEYQFTHDEVLGWLRQQYIVLNTHKIVEGDEWVLLNADSILNTKKVFKENGATIMYTDNLDFYQPYFHFINYATDIVKDKQPSYMCHFYLQEREVLEKLEEFIWKKHGMSLVALFKQFHRPLIETKYPWPMVPPLADNEIYGLFATEILGKTILTPKYHIKNVPAKNFVNVYNTATHDLELQSADDLPISFYEQHGIEYQHDLADALQYKNRY